VALLSIHKDGFLTQRTFLVHSPSRGLNDVPLINEVFFFFFFFVENEVAEIRQIPISSFNGMDQQI
jgi:hypothetical protein